MKKKIISFCMVFCMIFPCFFVVACKSKKDGDKVSPYTYSITLKNAKGKVDKSTLVGEYDYLNQTKTAWSENGNDYTISVTRTNVLSGNAIVSLLEGIDYSNLRLLVNGNPAEWIIKSGSNTNCADDAYLVDRQFRYPYSKMSTNTNIVVDFSNCETAKITLDVSDLKERGVSYYIVEDEFMTLAEAKTIRYDEFKTFTNNSITLDYGTMLAFNYSEQLVLNSESLQNIQKMNYAKYGSRYFVAFNDRIQYLKAQRNGNCEVYAISSDSALDGSLRILSASGLTYANSLGDLEAKRYASVNQETEYYDREMFAMSIFKGKKAFIELDSDAQAYNYYLVDKLDEKLSSTENLVAQKIMASNSRKYLEIDLTEENGELSTAKYLVRRPIRESDYFVVYAEGLKENTRFLNAEAIVIGNDNKPSQFHSNIKDSVLYYFKRGSAVRVSVPATISDKESNGHIAVRDETDEYKGITLYTQAYNPTTGKTVGSSTNKSTNPSMYNAMEWNEYNVESASLYRFSFTYSEDGFDTVTFSANVEDLQLYEGETVYYSTNPTEASSWKKLNFTETFALTSYVGSSLYYYIDSNRNDAYLIANNVAGENISETGKLYDCFGRELSGMVTINEVTIDLSKVRYLDVISGYYNYLNLNATIIRGYDETYHTVSINAVTGAPIMLSYSSYENEYAYELLDKNSNNIEIRYTGLNGAAEIYYYINGDYNQYMVIKNGAGEVISESELVYDNGMALQINGKYVYSLKLIGDYYDDNEEFYLDLVDVTYSLYNEYGDLLDVYTSVYMSKTVYQLVAKNNNFYYIICPNGFTPKIVNASGSMVVDTYSFEEMVDVPGKGKLYKFVFKFPSHKNYEPGSKFVVVYTENL